MTAAMSVVGSMIVNCLSSLLLLLCLQGVCEQLHLHPLGQPEKVPPTYMIMFPAQSYRDLIVFVFVLVPRSSTGRPDWTCVVVGFTSGYVRFYTEVG